jgi:hypothetical protein
MAFGYYASITVAHAKVPNTDQSNFPILVSGTYAGAGGKPDLRTTGNGGKVQNANGYDIYFYSDSGLTTRIPAERESYNATTGVIVWWVKKTLSHTVDTTIYMAYGDSGISTDPNSDGTYGKTSVWDANYKGVWHLPDVTGGASSVLDSTGINNGTPGGSPTNTTGQINGGGNFASASSQYVSLGTTLPIANQALTVSAWVKLTSGGQNTVISRWSATKNDWRITRESSTGKWRFDGTDSSNGGHYARSASVTSNSTWYYLVGNWVPSVGSYLWVNGTKYSETGSYYNGGLANSETPLLGADGGGTPANFFNGVIDEVRVSGITRSDDWITTEWNNQNDPASFYTMGSETSTGGGGAVIRNNLPLLGVN